MGRLVYAPSIPWMPPGRRSQYYSRHGFRVGRAGPMSYPGLPGSPPSKAHVRLFSFRQDGHEAESVEARLSLALTLQRGTRPGGAGGSGGDKGMAGLDALPLLILREGEHQEGKVWTVSEHGAGGEPSNGRPSASVLRE
jgi:hypothetical protein